MQVYFICSVGQGMRSTWVSRDCTVLVTKVLSPRHHSWLQQPDTMYRFMLPMLNMLPIV